MKKKFTFSLDDELVKDLKIQADKDYRSLSSELEKIIADYLKNID